MNEIIKIFKNRKKISNKDESKIDLKFLKNLKMKYFRILFLNNMNRLRFKPP